MAAPSRSFDEPIEIMQPTTEFLTATREDSPDLTLRGEFRNVSDASEPEPKVSNYTEHTKPDVPREDDDDDVELSDIADILARIEFIVPQTDDPNMPCFTWRVIFIGTLWNVLLSFVGTVLSFRTNAFSIPTSIAVILSYPMGRFLAAAIPKSAGEFWNPGPFSMKEHVLIYVIANTGAGTPYGLDNVIAQVYPQMMNNTSITFIQSLGFVL
ncbi:hypothetical protein HDU98_001777, partial [Podochytrium sp. JEL0797]